MEKKNVTEDSAERKSRCTNEEMTYSPVNFQGAGYLAQFQSILCKWIAAQPMIRE
jgi:hypothetical protein